KTALVRTACAAAMIRFHDAPSARCDRHTTIARTLQMSQVPRWGRVVRRTVSRTYGIVSAMPRHAGQQAENGCGVGHRWSTLSVNVPPKCATATAAAAAESNGRQEKKSTK